MDRKVIQQVRGFRTVDGAGVSLVRVLGNQTIEAYDPILMLDSFDSIDPDDYTAGFPMIQPVLCWPSPCWGMRSSAARRFKKKPPPGWTAEIA